MSVFSNNTQAEIIVEGPTGIKRVLSPGESFTGSNFYKRWVAANMLTLDEDDGSTWIDGDPASGKVLRTSNVVIGGASGFDDNELDYEALIGGPASFVQITCVSGTVTVRINEDSNTDMVIEADVTQTFQQGDLFVSKIQFSTDFSGGSASTVVVLATGRPV
jgi:hypothetical protein